MLSPPLTSDDAFEAREEVAPTYVHDGVREQDADLVARNFRLRFGTKFALQDVSIAIPRGCVTALIGPSGCGKSALLYSFNRLIDFSDDDPRVEGELLFGDRSIFAPNADVLALRRRTGTVFREPNIFPMSIYENVVFPLRIAGERRPQSLDAACERALRSVGLWAETEHRLDEPAQQLSEARQQLLCAARAIVAEPDVLLLDEPCSHLDPIATGKIEQMLVDLRGRTTSLIVTHNLQQASRVSDFIAFMDQGRVVEYGPTEAIFTKPAVDATQDYITGRFE